MGTIAAVSWDAGPAGTSGGATVDVPDVAHGLRSVPAAARNAGTRVVELAGPFVPREVAAPAPPAPVRTFRTRSGPPGVVQGRDVSVDGDGVLPVTDHDAGPHVLHREGT